MAVASRRKPRSGRSKAEAAAEWVPIDALVPWADNPRRNDKAVAEVAGSIRRFGFGAPIVARKADRVVIAGHTRLLAARTLGLDRVPVRYLDIDPVEARLLSLADNKLGEIAEWDGQMLAALLQGLEADGSLESLEGLGFSQADIAAALRAGEREEVDDDVPPLEDGPADSQTGVVYELGPHRLVCGDALEPATHALLLGDERAQMVWTDPPYGVAYEGAQGSPRRMIANDDLKGDDVARFLRAAFMATLRSCDAGAPWYVAAPARPVGIHFANELHALGIFRQRLCWVKDALVLGHSDYHYRHEDLYFGYAPGMKSRGRGRGGWFGGNAETSVFEVPRPKSSPDHPTTKPVDLIRRCIQNSSKRGWLILDPFGGSGSTLIAAAHEDRRGRLIELDPRYCDVIRRRWTRYAREAGEAPGTGALDER
jgi:DNA modification methylase